MSQQEFGAAAVVSVLQECGLTASARSGQVVASYPGASAVEVERERRGWRVKIRFASATVEVFGATPYRLTANLTESLARRPE